MNNVKIIGIFIFGIITPAIILYASYGNLSKSTELIQGDTSLASITESFKDANQNLFTFNDYSLFSLMLVEANNLKSIINKQHMKNTVMHIGYATISLGLSLILLGIKEENGGGEARIAASAITFDVKTGSTGAYVFVIGAIMATIGGSLPNKYQGSTIPLFDKTVDKKTLIQFQQIYTKGTRAQVAFDQCTRKTNEDVSAVEKCLIDSYMAHFGGKGDEK